LEQSLLDASSFDQIGRLAGEREKAIATGCEEFDTKPIEFDRLVATLRRVLAHRK
jgi:CheY-like chemotaxis protein